MVEIYNEELRDLLAPMNGKQRKQQNLQIKVAQQQGCECLFFQHAHA